MTELFQWEAQDSSLPSLSGEKSSMAESPEKLALGPCPKILDIVDGHLLREELMPLLREEVGLGDLKPPHEGRLFRTRLFPAKLAAQDRKEDEPLCELGIEIDHGITVAIRMFEEIGFSTYKLVPIATVLVLNQSGIEKQIAPVGIAFLTNGVDDLIGRKR